METEGGTARALARFVRARTTEERAAARPGRPGPPDVGAVISRCSAEIARLCQAEEPVRGSLAWDVLVDLAVPYAAHPDFREAWL